MYMGESGCHEGACAIIKITLISHLWSPICLSKLWLEAEGGNMNYVD